MPPRIEYRDTNPEALKAMGALNAYSDSCGVPAPLRRLVEVLVSKINGCTYCIRVHTQQALALGVDQQHLDDLDDWRGAQRYADADRALFAWVEHVTLVANGVPECALDALKSHFTDKEIVDLTFIVASMSAWNRIAIAFDREAPGG